ncbi:MAG: vitamin K epoxide reductase family protein [Desulfosudaceae bacterium]
MSNRQPGRVKPKPFAVYFVPALLLAVAGFFDSIYLSVSHYRVHTDISYKSFCAVSRAINCDTVSQSPYAVFLDIPVPLWGVIGYLLALLLLAFAGLDARRRPDGEKRGWTLLLLVSLGYSLYSIVLALISNYLIHSYCIMCIVSYGINFALLFYCWLIRRRFTETTLAKGLLRDIAFFVSGRRRQATWALLGTAVILLYLFLPAYWQVRPDELDVSLPRGLTAEGHPWIGAEEPELTIVEFTDYLCFQCRKMHFYLRDLTEAHPETIRLVHRNFPVDHEFNPIVRNAFHVGSGKMALLSVYAAKQGKFWEMNDHLFSVKRGSLSLKELADETGLPAAELAGSLRNPRIRRELRQDIREALSLGVTGTPSYLINGQVYLGVIPADLINKAIK